MQRARFLQASWYALSSTRRMVESWDIIINRGHASLHSGASAAVENSRWHQRWEGIFLNAERRSSILRSCRIISEIMILICSWTWISLRMRGKRSRSRRQGAKVSWWGRCAVESMWWCTRWSGERVGWLSEAATREWPSKERAWG